MKSKSQVTHFQYTMANYKHPHSKGEMSIIDWTEKLPNWTTLWVEKIYWGSPYQGLLGRGDRERSKKGEKQADLYDSRVGI